MNIEELKLIIEAVKAVSGDAAYIAIAWIFLDVLKLIIGCGTFLVFCYFGFKAIFNAVSANSAVDQINLILGRPGSSWVYTSSEYAAVIEAVRRLKESQKQP